MAFPAKRVEAWAICGLSFRGGLSARHAGFCPTRSRGRKTGIHSVTSKISSTTVAIILACRRISAPLRNGFRSSGHRFAPPANRNDARRGPGQLLKTGPLLASIFSEAEMRAKNWAPLSDEEKDQIDSTERGEWRSVGDLAARRAFWQEAAQGVLDGASSENLDFHSGARPDPSQGACGRRGHALSDLDQLHPPQICGELITRTRSPEERCRCASAMRGSGRCRGRVRGTDSRISVRGSFPSDAPPRAPRDSR